MKRFKNLRQFIVASGGKTHRRFFRSRISARSMVKRKNETKR